MTTIYLIRHGQASIGSANYDVLSPIGRQQSKILGKHLHNIGIDFDIVYSGSLQRQQDTASIALEQSGASVTINPAFNEYHHQKIFEHYLTLLADTDQRMASAMIAGHNAKLTYPVFAAIMKAWTQDTSMHPQLESWIQFKERVAAGINTATADNNHDARIAIFSSGGVICTLMHSVLQCPAVKVFEFNWGIYNAGISVFKLQDGTLKLREYNNVSHLQLMNDKTLITNI